MKKLLFVFLLIVFASGAYATNYGYGNPKLPQLNTQQATSSIINYYNDTNITNIYTNASNWSESPAVSNVQMMGMNMTNVTSIEMVENSTFYAGTFYSTLPIGTSQSGVRTYGIGGVEYAGSSMRFLNMTETQKGIAIPSAGRLYFYQSIGMGSLVNGARVYFNGSDFVIDMDNSTGHHLQVFGDIEATGSICNSTGSCVGGSGGSGTNSFDNITVGNSTVNLSINREYNSYWGNSNPIISGKSDAGSNQLGIKAWVGIMASSGNYPGFELIDLDTGQSSYLEMNTPENETNLVSQYMPLEFTAIDRFIFSMQGGGIVKMNTTTGWLFTNTTNGINLASNDLLTAGSVNATTINVGTIRLISNTTGDYQYMGNGNVMFTSKTTNYTCIGAIGACGF